MYCKINCTYRFNGHNYYAKNYASALYSYDECIKYANSTYLKEKNLNIFED